MSYIYAYKTKSTPQRILRSGVVSTPVDSVPLSLPRRSPRGHQSTVEETAAVLFAHDDKHEDDVIPAAAQEKGEANKKKRPTVSRVLNKQERPRQRNQQ